MPPPPPTQEERQAIIDFLVSTGQYGNPPSEEDIQGAHQFPTAYGYERGAKQAGADSPLDTYRKRLRQEMEQAYGPRAADYLMTGLAGQFAQVTGTPEQQRAQLPNVIATIDRGGYQESALARDKEERQRQFEQLARESYLAPLLDSISPQDHVTLAAANRMIQTWWAGYEQQYQEGIRSGVVLDRSFMGEFLEGEGRQIMRKLRPELTDANLEAMNTGLILQQSVQVMAAANRAIAAAEKSYNEYREELETQLDATIIALGQDDSGASARLQKIRWQMLADPALREQFVEAVKAGPVSAQDFLDAQVGPRIRSAVAGTDFELAGMTDTVIGSLVGIRKAPGEKAKAQAAEAAADAFSQIFDASLLAEDAATRGNITTTAEDLWKRAGGNPGVAGQLLTAAINAARDQGRAAGAETTRVTKATDYGRSANMLLSEQTPDVIDRLRARYGGDPAAAIFLASGQDPKKAQDLLEHAIRMAQGESGRAGQYRDTFSEAQGFGQGALSPRLRALLAQGAHLNEQDAQELGRGYTFSGSFSNVLSEEGGTVEERNARADAATAALWKQAGGDPVKFQGLLRSQRLGEVDDQGRITRFASPEAERDFRSRLPNYGQSGPSFELPTGGLQGRSSLAFTYGLTKDPAIRKQIEDLDEKERQQAAQARAKANPPPRGRKL